MAKNTYYLIRVAIIPKRYGRQEIAAAKWEARKDSARERIMIEHINRESKVFKIMAERYRNCRRRHKLRMTLICAIRNYEIIN